MDTPRPSRRPRPPRPARSAAGFTVVEVMVAAFVMVFGITSAILVMQSGFRALDTARKTTLASQIMQSEMERIRMLSWSRIQALATQSAADPSVDFTSIFPQNTEVEKKMFQQISDTFTATRVMEPLADHDGEVYRIQVNIAWRGIDGVPHRRSSSTQYCKDGLYAYYYRTP